jgi:homoserine O-acetyltransferase
VNRFDANSYLYITKAMDYFDLSAGRSSLAAAFANSRCRFLVLSFTSDWLYPTYQSLETVSALRSRGLDVAFSELSSTYGHDAFLVEVKEQSEMIAGFLASVQRDASPASVRVPSHPAQKIIDRADYNMIGEMIEPGARVLDLGCGGGELLAWLRDHKQVAGQGVEIDPDNVRRAIARGVSVYQGDIEQGLADYPDQSFDFALLSQTLQEMRYPLRVLKEMLRVGRHAIIAFPNFGHWSTRIAHLFSGRSPKTRLFPYDWYESPNIHFLTVHDFVLLCRKQNWIIERQMFVRGNRKANFAPNLLAELAVFSLRASHT